MNPLLLDKINTHPEFHSDQTHQQYTLANVSWSLYEGLLMDFGHNFPGLRVHYLSRFGRSRGVVLGRESLLGLFSTKTRLWVNRAQSISARSRFDFAGDLCELSRTIGCYAGVSASHPRQVGVVMNWSDVNRGQI